MSKKQKGCKHEWIDVSSVEPCGDCCLVHRRFTLEQEINQNAPGTINVFSSSTESQAACVPGNGESEVGSWFPFGSLLIRNIGQNAFDVEITPESSEGVFQRTILPGAQFAYAGVIRFVDLLLPGDPIHALFEFDLYQYPSDPI